MARCTTCTGNGFAFADENAADSHFLTMAHMIAERNKCKIMDIDMEKRVLHINGPKENQMICIMEIVEAFETYLE